MERGAAWSSVSTASPRLCTAREPWGLSWRLQAHCAASRLTDPTLQLFHLGAAPGDGHRVLLCLCRGGKGIGKREGGRQNGHQPRSPHQDLNEARWSPEGILITFLKDRLTFKSFLPKLE